MIAAPRRWRSPRPIHLALVAALLALGGCDGLFEQVTPDATPPSLDVLGIADGDTVSAPEVTITVLAEDDRDLDRVTWQTDHGEGGLCTPLSDPRFACGPIPLPYGATTITLSAWDAADNRTTRTLTVNRPAPPPGSGAFDIELLFYDHVFTASQLAAFETAVARWERIVVGDLASFPIDRAAGQSCGQDEPAISATVDDLLIFVTSDGDGSVGGVLGVAGPCLSRASGVDVGTNAVGFMAFDAADLGALEAGGDLVETIVHEMGHVLGIGTNWEFPPFDLLAYLPSDGAPDCRTAGGFLEDPTYTGASGVDAWRDLGGAGDVPVEETGGLGTQCGHWDEETFGRELMTGFLQSGLANPLSALTVASLEDLGLAVDRTQADPYALPLGPGALEPSGHHLAGREILLRPRGTIDPATGEVELGLPGGP
jgi:hypothetical protein